MGWGGVVSPTPTPNPRLYPFILVITFDLSGMEGPAGYYTDASIALRIIWPFKLHHFIKVGIPSPRGGPYLL